jgi:hypothetical protein
MNGRRRSANTHEDATVCKQLTRVFASNYTQLRTPAAISPFRTENPRVDGSIPPLAILGTN